MVVVVIIAILAAITLPAYSDYVKRGRITDAVAKLSDASVHMEQFFQDNRSYVGSCTAGTVAPLPVATTYFSFACTPTPTASTYLIVATGADQMAGFSYSIAQDGTKTSSVPSAWGANSNNCWIMSKGGAC